MLIVDIIVSSWIMTIVLCIFVNVFIWGSTNMFIMMYLLVHRFQQLKMQWKVLIFLTAVGALAVPELVKVYGITFDEQILISEINSYGSMIIFLIALCVLAKKNSSGKKQQVDYEATQRDLHQRFSIATQLQQPNLVKPPCLCYMCMSMNNAITEESELQTQHTELMRRYLKLDTEVSSL